MDYRVYFMDFRARHIDWFEPISAETDQQAIEMADRLRCWKPLELWQAGRRIRNFAST